MTGSHAGQVRLVGKIQERVDGVSFTLGIDNRRARARLQFSGRHNVGNALLSAGVGVALGLSIEEMVAGLEAASPVKGRLIWRRAGTVRILDDTYNANPASVRAAVGVLAAARGARRLLVAMGDMLELGDMAPEAHRDVGRQVAALGVAEFVGVGPLMRHAVEAAREAGLLESHHAEAGEDAVALLLKRLAPADRLLVKGSRGMRMEQVVDALVARLAGGG